MPRKITLLVDDLLDKLHEAERKTISITHFDADTLSRLDDESRRDDAAQTHNESVNEPLSYRHEGSCRIAGGEPGLGQCSAKHPERGAGKLLDVQTRPLSRDEFL